MRVWIDLTAPAHPLVLRPVIERLRTAGHHVEVTARDYAQTIQLCDLHGIAYTRIGAHGGRGRAGKVRALVERTAAVTAWARPRRFDLAVAHGSNDLALAARALGVPAVNMFDYEFATYQHQIGCRLARRVLVPEAIPAERLAVYGARPPKLVQYPGLKEEYYLADFEPDPAVPLALGLDPAKVQIVVRTPPDVSLYHRRSNPLFQVLVERLGPDPDVQAVVLPRTADQGAWVRALGLRSLVVPERAVDAQSLIAQADLVISSGGTMNREAVALGVPVFTTYGGRLGGVDEWLIREGRLRPLADPAGLRLEKRTGVGERVRRDPGRLVAWILGAAER